MNCWTVLQRFSRDYPDMVSKEFEVNFKQLSEGIVQIKAGTCGSLNELRGF